jgi:hypothetical protein
MGVSHSTLNMCINTNKTYLKSFKFSILKDNSINPTIKNFTTFLELVKQKRKQFNRYKHRNKKIQKIHAQHIFKPELSQIFESQRNCAQFLKADRGTVRKYIKNPELGNYRKVWKFKIIVAQP